MRNTAKRKSLLANKLLHVFVWSVFFVMLTSSGVAQTNRINTLFKKLDTVKQDSDKVKIYYSISRQYWSENADSALIMAQKSLNLAQKIHYEKGIALAYLIKGVALGYKGNFPESLECHLQGLRISKKLKMEGLEGNEYGNIGIIYNNMEDYTKALYYQRQAYRIVLKQHDPTGFGTYSILVNIGEIFKKRGQPDSAIAYNSKALLVAKKVKDSASIALALYNIGDNCITKKNYDKAFSCLFQSLGIAKRMKDNEGMAYCNSSLALTYFYTYKYGLSKYYAEMGLEEGKKTGIIELIKLAYNVLYLTDQKTDNYKQSLYYRDLEIALDDSINAVEKERSVKNIQSADEEEKQKDQIVLLNKDKIISQKELEKVKFKQDILAVGVVIILLVAFILLRNYTQKRKLSEQLALQNKDISEKNKQLEELVLVKDRLFSIIGHDLRGPIHTVTQVVDALKDKSFSEEESAYFIDKASETLTVTAHLVENLLYWARSQMDGMQVIPANFDAQKLIEKNIALLKVRAAEKKVILVNTGPAKSIIAYADEAMIDIVIRNLVENAVKFSKEGDTVTVSIEQKEASLIIAVKDSGKGIPEEAQAKIFDKFSSYTTFGTASEKGSGLGLLLCKELVEANGGSLWFESKAGIGSSFYFTIPPSK